MSCVSPNLNDAAKQAGDEGINAVNTLKASMEAQKSQYEAGFDAEVKSHLAAAGITDGKAIGANGYVKTEFTSEFSLDKIAGVISAALEVAIKASAPDSPEPATSPEALEAYKDLVNKVAEAAKSKTKSSSSLSFSMDRLAPGMYVFLYAFSANISDSKLFGDKTVSSTCIFYKVVESIDDIKNSAAFGAAVIDSNTYLAMKRLQGGLVGRLGLGTQNAKDGGISVAGYTKLDGEYSTIVATLKERLDANGFPTNNLMAMAGYGISSRDTHMMVKDAVAKLGYEHQSIIDQTNERIANGYYL